MSQKAQLQEDLQLTCDKKTYALYAGMTGSFGGATFQTFAECKDDDEADREAYALAMEIYESYEGMYGIMSWEDCREDLIDSFPNDNITDADVNAHYQEEKESWTEWWAEPFDPNKDYDC